MGTKADFYVGIGPDAEWLGSIFNNGDVWHIPLNMLIQINKIMFEEMALDFLKENDSVIADEGQPWIHGWADSRLTDYSYIFDPAREKVLMYQRGIDYLVDPVKVLQGYSMMECIELYGTPAFPTMIPGQEMTTEETLKEYGYTLTSPL